MDPSSRIIIIGFADGIMRTLLIHPDRLENWEELIDIHVTSALTIHSDESEHTDIIDLISVRAFIFFIEFGLNLYLIVSIINC